MLECGLRWGNGRIYMNKQLTASAVIIPTRQLKKDYKIKYACMDMGRRDRYEKGQLQWRTQMFLMFTIYILNVRSLRNKFE